MNRSLPAPSEGQTNNSLGIQFKRKSTAAADVGRLGLFTFFLLEFLNGCVMLNEFFKRAVFVEVAPHVRRCAFLMDARAVHLSLAEQEKTAKFAMHSLTCTQCGEQIISPAKTVPLCMKPVRLTRRFLSGMRIAHIPSSWLRGRNKEKLLYPSFRITL